MKKLSALVLAPLVLHCFSSASVGAAPPPQKSGLNLSSVDKSVDPSRDFFLYANGGWLKAHPIPPQAPEWGKFHELSQKQAQTLYGILATCAMKRGPAGSIEQQLGDFYQSGMNVDALNSQGIQPLKRDLAQIRAVTDLKSLEAVMISLHKRGIHPFFALSPQQDAKDSETVIGDLSQAGLGMPDQDYYLREDERSAKQRAAYQEHLHQAFRRLGYSDPDAKTKGESVYALEKRLAQSGLSREERRDPLKVYHPSTQAELAAASASWSWPQYLTGMGVAAPAKINLQSPRYIQSVYSLLESTDIATLRDYLEWKLLDASCEYLSEDLAKFDSDFDRLLSGAPVQPGRNSMVFSTVSGYLGQALGEKYAEKAFSPKAKAKVKEMADLLVQVLGEDFDQLSWMSSETRKEAHAKLAAVKFKIGRPDVWPNYKGLKITSGGYLENVWRVREFLLTRALASIGQPVDQNAWHMSAATVNAYYDPAKNEVVIPCGIMQPPFFSLEADDSLNFGGLGTVLGHEITHGFDDEGRKFDQRGNLRDWWAPEDLKKFQALAEKVEQQYSAYTVLDGHLHLNGKLVMGESIADLGGIRLAYLAYQKLMQKRPGKVLDGYTPEQRFFLGYAGLWAVSSRSDYERLMVNLNTHPPGNYRVNGPLSNFPEFAKAFHCAPGSPMVRENPISLW